MRMRCRFAAVSAAALLAAGCETYAPAPLDQHSQLAPSLAALQMPAGLEAAEPLSVEAIAQLALVNNPDLRSARADRGIAEAQLLQAGLLPNPQLSYSYGFLRAGPGTSNQWTAGLSEDIRALVTFSATEHSAEMSARQAQADLVWQEWQVVGKARLAAVDLLKQDEARHLLTEAHATLADRYARDRQAVERGDLTRETVAPDLAALADIDKQLADADLKAQAQRRDLNLLLGLDPAVELHLAPAPDIPAIDPAAVVRLKDELPERRPDLIALRLGYAAQEDKLRAAILGQFPALIFGGSGGHDTSKIYSIGPTITMDLPIFNHNQGNIAIETATREKLHVEYENRLNADRAEIHGILADQALERRQLEEARRAAAEAERAAGSATVAYASALIDARSYADLATASLARRQEVVAIEQALLEGQIALATLTGIAMPKADPLPEIQEAAAR
jgi:outer membrane protein TolC